MKRISTLPVILSALGAAGCNVSFGSAVGSAPVNSCSSASDCAGGAACVQNVCTTTSYDLDGLLLQVSVPATSTFAPGSVYVIDPSAAVSLKSSSAAQPFSSGFNVPLYAPISISGQVVLDPSTVLPTGCNLPDLSIPAQITFYRVPRFAGLPFDPVDVTTTQVGTAKTPRYVFDVDLVSGSGDQYDVYVQPTLPSDCPLDVPPYYLQKPTIDAGMVLRLPPTGQLTADISGITADNMADWRIDLVEPDRGLPMSTGTVITPDMNGTSSTVTAAISTVDPTQWPILRLSPVDTSQPTVFFSLQGAVINSSKTNPQVSFTVMQSVFTPVQVKGHVLGSDGLTPVPSRLAIQSQMLGGTNGSNATYFTNGVLTDQNGLFTVNLPPGQYWVRAFPIAESALSITDTTLTVPQMSMPTCVCAVTVQLQGKADLQATILTPTGQPLASTAVGVTPSETPVVPDSYFSTIHTLSPLPARDESTTTDGSGTFSLLADLGVSDLSVQTDPATHYPWYVHPQISPEPGTQPSSITLPSPAFLGGAVLDPQGNPIPNAGVVAWYPVRASDGTLTGTVVKIATTTTGPGGSYGLVLPAQVGPFTPGSL